MEDGVQFVSSVFCLDLPRPSAIHPAALIANLTAPPTPALRVGLNNVLRNTPEYNAVYICPTLTVIVFQEGYTRMKETVEYITATSTQQKRRSLHRRRGRQGYGNGTNTG